MKGIDICEKFYLEHGKSMLEKEFPEFVSRISVGVCGEGSDCMGFDDEISRDHDFDAGFCLFITKEDEEKIGFKLERAYSKLPKEFLGLKRQILSPTGGNRRGVIVIEDFYSKFLGSPIPPKSCEDWLLLPSYSLLCASNGRIFKDELGVFSSIRNQIKKGYPLDVKKKKIAAHIINMAQSGQYNYSRCIERGETGAAQLAIFEFVKHAISTIYLLNDKFEPYYKWAYRGLRELKKLSELEFSLIGLTELGNSKKQASEKNEIIEDISSIIISELKTQALTSATCNNLETHAYSVMDKIENLNIRNLNIFDGI